MSALEIVRDSAIVLLAIESLVIGIVLVIMLVQLRKLIIMLREEVAPLLDTANQTANKVQGTVGLVSETVVTPLVRAQSWFTGARTALQSLMFVGKNVAGRSADVGDADSDIA